MLEDLPNVPESIPTPFLLIEEKIVRNNIRRIHDYADRHGFSVRAHVKTHKSIAIARMQIDAGAVGIAVAKADEAKIMANLGNVDITVAYPVVGETRTEGLARLSVDRAVSVAADSEYVMDGLSHAAAQHNTVMGIYVIFDAGLHRCGVSDPKHLVRLVRYAKTRPGLRYKGVQMYLGHLYGDAAGDPESFDKINRLWGPGYKALCSAGLPPETVSSGSTPSLFNTHLVDRVNEIRVGTALLNDYFVLKFGHCSLEECALRVVATVVSDLVPGQVLIDAGSKALSAKQLLRHEALEMGYVVEYPEAKIFRLHEEHGWVDVSRCRHQPKTGDRMSIVPVNAALCMNLYDHFYLRTGREIVRKERVDARGCLV
ncbi:MAG: alanine racemase [Deltaproteobacteria bacterium]|nr:alanine racemase [Deltaproteobacteria bacterium]